MFKQRVLLEKLGKNVKLSIPKEYITKQGSYKVVMDTQEVTELYNSLCSLTYEPIKNEDKRYWDDVSTYANGVERTLGLSNNQGVLNLSLIAYTDDDAEDNWILLTPKRTAKLAGLLYPYSIPQ